MPFSKERIHELTYTGAYVVVCKTAETSEGFFDRVLSYLRTRHSRFAADEFIADFVAKYGSAEARPPAGLDSKMRLGPTEIIWNSQKKSKRTSHILNIATSLKTFQSLPLQCMENAKPEVRYITEAEYETLNRVFTPERLIAVFIVDDGKLNAAQMIDFYFDRKTRYGDKMQVLFSHSEPALVNRLLDDYDKYIVKKNLHKYRKNSINGDLVNDSFFFHITGLDEGEDDDASQNGDKEEEQGRGEAVDQWDTEGAILDEIVLNILTTFLADLTTQFNNPVYEFDTIKHALAHPNSKHSILLMNESTDTSTHEKLKRVYSGAEVKRHGDLCLLVGRDEAAIGYYVLSNCLFSLEGKYLEYSNSLFSLAIVLYNMYNTLFAKWDKGATAEKESSAEEEDEKEEGEETEDDEEERREVEYKEVGRKEREKNVIVKLAGRRRSRKNRNSVEYIVRKCKKYEGRNDKHAVDALVKAVHEKPLSYTIFYLNRALSSWLRTFDNSNDLLHLFTFYLNLLLRIKSVFVTRVINAFIVYATRVYEPAHQAQLLKYVIELLETTGYRRKLFFYRFVLDDLNSNRSGTHALEMKSEDALNDDFQEVMGDVLEVYKVDGDSCAPDGAVNDLLEGGASISWYRIKDRILDNSINKILSRAEKDRHVTDSDKREQSKDACTEQRVERIYVMKYLNLFKYLFEIKHTLPHARFERIKGGFVREENRFRVAHLVLTGVYATESDRQSNASTPSTRGRWLYNVDVDTFSATAALTTGLDRLTPSVYYVGGSRGLRFARFPLVHSMRLCDDDCDFRYSGVTRVDHPYSAAPRGGFIALLLTKKCATRFEARSGGGAGCKVLARFKCTIETGLEGLTHLAKKLDEADRAPVLDLESPRVRERKYVEYEYQREEKVVHVGKTLRLQVVMANPFPVNLVLERPRPINLGCTIQVLNERVEVPAFACHYKFNLHVVVKEPGRFHILGLKFLIFNSLRCYQLVADIGVLKHLKAEEENMPALLDSFKEFCPVGLNAVENSNRTSVSVYFTDLSRIDPVLHSNSADGEELHQTSRVNATESTGPGNSDPGANDKRAGLVDSGANVSTSEPPNTPTVEDPDVSNSDAPNVPKIELPNQSGDRMVSVVSSIFDTARTHSTNTLLSLNSTHSINNNSPLLPESGGKDDLETELESLWNSGEGAGTTLRSLKLCAGCSFCRYFYYFYNQFTAPAGTGVSITETENTVIGVMDSAREAESEPESRDEEQFEDEDRIDLIEGEYKLLYAKLTNDNEGHTLTNITLSIVPETGSVEGDESDPQNMKRQMVKNISIGEDYVNEKIAARSFERFERALSSRYFTVLSKHCVITSPASEAPHFPTNVDGNVDGVGVGVGDLELGSGASLFVPILLKASSFVPRFAVLFDYGIRPLSDSASPPGSEATDKKVPEVMPGYMYKKIAIDLEPGLELSELRIENNVGFNLRHFVYNLESFSTLYKKSTLTNFMRHGVVFDNKSVKLFLNVVNNTDRVFSCRLLDQKFTSNPSNASRWRVNLSRFSQTLKNEPGGTEHVVMSLVDLLNIRWKLGSRLGSLSLVDLFTQTVQREWLLRRFYLKCYWTGVNECNGLMCGVSGTRDSYLPKGLREMVKMDFLRVPSLVKGNFAKLVGSEIRFKIVAHVKEELMEGKGEVDVEINEPFKVCICARNVGRSTLDDYKLLILPFGVDFYQRVDALHFTGSLEQLGHQPLYPSSRGSGVNPGNRAREWDEFVKVAEIEFTVGEFSQLGVTAAIIPKGGGTIYLHHHPLVVNIR